MICLNVIFVLQLTSYKYVNIDWDVLNELPEDIKAEIIREHKLHKPTSKNNSDITTNTNNANASVRNANENKSKASTSKVEHAQNLCLGKQETKQKTGFHMLNQEDFKVALIKWLNSKKGPQETDIKILGEYFRELAINKEINKLIVSIKFLFRYALIVTKLFCKITRFFFFKET